MIVDELAEEGKEIPGGAYRLHRIRRRAGDRLNIPRGISARAVISALETDGFLHVRTTGSHRRYKHPDGRRATVSCHKESDTLPIGTLRSIILLQARWTEGDLRRLKLIK